MYRIAHDLNLDDIVGSGIQKISRGYAFNFISDRACALLYRVVSPVLNDGKQIQPTRHKR